jgi:peroxiredoxin
MRLFFKKAVVLLACFGLLGFGQAPHRAPEVPHMAILNASGPTFFSLKALRGRVVLIAFWNSEDAGFETYMATLRAWDKAYRSRGLQVVGVYVPHWQAEQAQEDISRIIKSYGILFPILSDRQARMQEAYGSWMSPSVFCVDRKGFLRASYSGLFDTKDVRTMCEALCEEAP